MKCLRCLEKAEYIYNGKSLCERCYQEETSDCMEDPRINETEKKVDTTLNEVHPR